MQVFPADFRRLTPQISADLYRRFSQKNAEYYVELNQNLRKSAGKTCKILREESAEICGKNLQNSAI
ncbi:MAG: hypothetical protein DYG98_24935 [Haliscomenobacteraceae bacterium CHB4]|nr:hypothetical protein [Haliscomenobacteraceae bacterium CHB4]